MAWPRRYRTSDSPVARRRGHAREEIEDSNPPNVTLAGDAPAGAPTHARQKARWPREKGAKPFVGTDPVRVTKALIYLMRDRGVLSPDDLRGCSRRELEYTAMAMKAKRTSYETFDEALDDAIALGWIESYESNGELFYLPNYRRNANPTV